MLVTGCDRSRVEQEPVLDGGLPPAELEALDLAREVAVAGFSPSEDRVGASISLAAEGDSGPRIIVTGSNYDSTGTARICAEPSAVEELRSEFPDGIPRGRDSILVLYSKRADGGPAAEKPPCAVCIDVLSRLQLPGLRVISGADGVKGVKRWSFTQDLQPLADLTEVGVLLSGAVTQRGVAWFENFSDIFGYLTAQDLTAPSSVSPEVWNQLRSSAEEAAQRSRIFGFPEVRIGVAAAFAAKGVGAHVLQKPECSWESGGAPAGGAVVHILKRARRQPSVSPTVQALLFYVDVPGDSWRSSYPLFTGLARQLVYDQANIDRINVPIVVYSRKGCLVTSINDLCVHYKKPQDSATWQRFFTRV